MSTEGTLPADLNTTAAVMQIEDDHLLRSYKKKEIALVRGEGCYVWDLEGNRYLDFYGGHCVTLLGHCPPPVVAAVQKQVGELMFYSTLVYSTARAAATKALVEFAPRGMKTIFFCSSGTEANETAMKLIRKHTGKPAVVSMVGDFHGRTLGSLSVTWNAHYREPYQSAMGPVHWTPMGDIEKLEALVKNSDDIAAVIIEPIQSMAGVVSASREFFEAARRLCDHHGIKLIFDEVQTGVGRTGTFSFAELIGVKPDIITLAKSLGSGVPVGAVLVSDEIADAVEYGDQGTTFGGGMVAMAAVSSTLAMLRDQKLMERAPWIFEQISRQLGPHVSEIRGAGCLIGVELKEPAAPVVIKLLKRGIIVGGSGEPNTIRVMPALVAGEEEIDFFTTTLIDILSEHGGRENAA